MQNWEMGMQATEAALNSQGSAMRENAEYMQSLEARINKLKANWEALSVSFGEAFLTETFIGITSFLTSLANGARLVTDAFGALPILFLALNAIIWTFSKGYRQSMITVATSTSTSLRLVNAFGASVKSLGMQMGLTRVAATALASTLKGLLVSTGVGIGFVALGFVIEKLLGHLDKVREKERERKEQLEQSVNTYREHGREIEKLVTEYQELEEARSGDNFTTEQEERYYAITKQIGEYMPSLVSHIDEKGRTHLFAAEAVQAEANAMKQLAEETANANAQKALQNYEDNKDDRDKNIEKRIKKEKELNELLNTLQEYDNVIARTNAGEISGGYVDGTFVSEYAYDKLLEQIRDARYEIAELNKEVSSTNTGMLASFKEMVSSLIQINQLNISDGVKSQFYEIISAIDVSKMTTEDYEKMTKQLGEEMSKVGNIEVTSDRLFDALEEFFSDVPEATDKIKQLRIEAQKAREETAKGIPVINDYGVEIGYLGGTTGHTEESFINFREELDENGQVIYRATALVTDQAVALEELEKAMNSASSEMKTLNQALETQQKEGELSADTILSLITKYPELTSKIENHNGRLSINEEALIAVKEAALDSHKTQISLLTGLDNASKAALTNRLEMYGIEIEAIKDKATAAIEAAKLEAEAQAILAGIPREILMNPSFFPLLSEEAKKVIDQYRSLVTLQNDVMDYGQNLENLENRLNLLNEVGKSSSSSSTSSATDKIFQRFPYYKQQVEDLTSDISKLDDAILAMSRQIQQADKLENTSRKMQLEREYVQLLDRRKMKFHEIANAMRELRDTEVLPQFSASFSDFLRGRNFEDISQTEIQRYIDDLSERISKTQDEKLKSDLENRRELFSYFVGIFSDLNGAITQQSDGWWQDLFDRIDTVARIVEQQISNTFEQLQNKVAPMDEEISNLQRKLDLLNEWDEGYSTNKINYSNQIIEQYKQQEKEIEGIIKNLKEMQKHYKDHPSAINRITQELKKWEETLADIPLHVKKINDDLRQQRVSMADQIVDAIKKAYEVMRDAELDSIDKAMKKEEERHNERMKQIDDEQERFEEYINEQLKLLDRQFETDDYEKDLNKLQKEEIEIQKELDKVLLDDSIEGNARRLELERELQGKKEEIERLQTNRSRNLRKQNLQDLLNDNRKELESERKTEKDKTDTERTELENRRKEIERHYEKILNNEAYFNNLRESMIRGHTTVIKGEMAKVSAEISSLMDRVGSSIDENLNDKLQRSITTIGNLKSAATTMLDDMNMTDGFYQPKDMDESNIIGEMQKNSEAWFTASDEQKKNFHEKNKELASRIGATYNTKGYWLKNGLRLYHEGGEVGGRTNNLTNWLKKNLNLKQYETLGILKKGEFVIDTPATVIDSMRQLLSSNLRTKSNSGKGDSYFSFDIRIDKLMGGKEGADQLFKEIQKNLRIGRYR